MSDDFDDLYGGKYLAASELKAPITGTIEKIDEETFAKQGERSRNKKVLFVRGGKKGVVVNKTNAITLAGAFGKDFSTWVGQRIVIKAEPTMFAGKPVTGLRMYPAPNGGGHSAAPTPKPPPAPAVDPEMDDEVPF